MLGQEGHALTVAARRPDKLAAAAEELRGAGYDVHEVAGNMAHEETIKGVVAAHEERFGRLDIAHNNAGIMGVFLAAIVIGAGFGMLFGVISFSLNRNRRDFSSVMQMVGTRYDLITEPELLHQARQTLIDSAN